MKHQKKEEEMEKPEVQEEAPESADSQIPEETASAEETPQEEKVPAEEDFPTAAELAELKKQAELGKDYYRQLIQLKADFENFRKRTEKCKPDLINFGRADILGKLMPLYDMLLMAQTHLNKKDGKADTNIVKGLEMIFKEFSKLFDSEGLRPIEVVNRAYDPMTCEIMGTVDGDEKNDGLVVEELRRGFYLGDRVLRTAWVKMARAVRPPEAPASADEGKEAAEKSCGKN